MNRIVHKLSKKLGSTYKINKVGYEYESQGIVQMRW